MSKIDEVGNEAEKKIKGFLSGKKIWVFWIVFTLIIGIVFAICYGVMYLLSFRWWILLLVIIVGGMASGTYAYINGLNWKGTKNDNETV